MPLGGEGYDFYPERRHLEHEFDCFWAAQAQHHAALLIAAARDRLRRIIFFQRPLKAPKVGGCTFFNEVPAPPPAPPPFQERRLYEEDHPLEIQQAGAASRNQHFHQAAANVLKTREQAMEDQTG